MKAIHNAMLSRLLRHSFAVLCCTVLALTAMSITSSAKGCEEYCSGIKIYNCTNYEYKIAFELCCPDREVITSYYEVPVGCDGAASFDFYPCRIVGVVFSSIPRGVCYEWDPFECYLKIYYCD